jgi:uncharacterized protein YciU (UPF0263 family)
VSKVIKFPDKAAIYPKADLNELIGHKIRILPDEEAEPIDVLVVDLDYDEESELVFVTTDSDFDAALPIEAALRYHAELRLRELEERVKALELKLDQ